MYAGDILLLVPLIRELEMLLIICEKVLNLLDVVINTRKSCCLRIGPRSDVACASVCTAAGVALP